MTEECKCDGAEERVNEIRSQISDLHNQLEESRDRLDDHLDGRPDRSDEDWDGCPVDDWDEEMREWSDERQLLEKNTRSLELTIEELDEEKDRIKFECDISDIDE